MALVQTKLISLYNAMLPSGLDVTPHVTKMLIAFII
jgi:hypothetical protein